MISPAYDVVLKFKRFFGMVDKPKDDFILIEDNYSPEIIEAVIVWAIITDRVNPNEKKSNAAKIL